MSDKTLNIVRKIMRSATNTHSGGCSASVHMLMQKQKDIDLAVDANTLPLVMWTTRINVANYRGD